MYKVAMWQNRRREIWSDNSQRLKTAITNGFHHETPRVVFVYCQSYGTQTLGEISERYGAGMESWNWRNAEKSQRRWQTFGESCMWHERVSAAGLAGATVVSNSYDQKLQQHQEMLKEELCSTLAREGIAEVLNNKEKRRSTTWESWPRPWSGQSGLFKLSWMTKVTFPK